VYRLRIDLVSGRFAMIERSRDFTLVPWRQVLERQVGKSVSGLVPSDGTSWSIGRGRSGPAVEYICPASAAKGGKRNGLFREAIGGKQPSVHEARSGSYAA
jgi:hypothetical protein